MQTTECILTSTSSVLKTYERKKPTFKKQKYVNCVQFNQHISVEVLYFMDVLFAQKHNKTTT